MALGLWSCSGDQGTTTDADKGSTVHGNATDTIVSTGEPVVLEGCYQMVVQRDTATLYLDVAGTAISGKLVYNHYEKDDNEGSFKGELRDNLLIADYLFRSEGVTSTRKVAFKIRDSVLLEGYGEVLQRDAREIYQHTDRLQFDSTHPFRKIDCRPGDR